MLGRRRIGWFAFLIAFGCKPAPAPQTPAAPPVAPAAPSVPTHVHHGPGHGNGEVPIDCPLRAQGIDPAGLRPFEDVEKYIAFLDRADRAEWQKPEQTIAALGLTGSETIVDLGAGSGYFAFRFARALGEGRVVAVDVEPEMVRHIHHRAMAEGIKNLEAVLGAPDDPAVPPDADLVFLCDVLHHVAQRDRWLEKLAKKMKPGARLALVEFKEGPLPQGPPESAKIPRAELLRLAAAAGLQLEREKADVLPYQWLLVFRKP